MNMVGCCIRLRCVYSAIDNELLWASQAKPIDHGYIGIDWDTHQFVVSYWVPLPPRPRQPLLTRNNAAKYALILVYGTDRARRFP